jgi:hypothetical protein
LQLADVPAGCEVRHPSLGLERAECSGNAKAVVIIRKHLRVGHHTKERMVFSTWNPSCTAINGASEEMSDEIEPDGLYVSGKVRNIRTEKRRKCGVDPVYLAGGKNDRFPTHNP